MSAGCGVNCFLLDWYWYEDGPFLQKCLERGYLKSSNKSKVKFAIHWANHNWVDIHPAIRSTVKNPQRSASMLDLIFYDFCNKEPNLTLMLNTTVTEVNIIDSSISSVIAYRHSTEDKFEIKSKIFCDCTGDGRIGFEAKAKFIQGRESKSDFDESLAQDKRDNKSLGSTILLQARKHNKPMPFIPPNWVRKFTEDELNLRPHGGTGVDQGFEYGYWWVEWGGQLDTIKDNEKTF